LGETGGCVRIALLAGLALAIIATVVILAIWSQA